MLSAVGFLDRTNISIAGPAIRSELGLDDIHLGWVFSAFLLGYAAFQVVGGWLAYRFGPRLVLAAGVLWWGLFSALTTLANSHLAHALLILITIRFALGAGEAVIYPASNQFVAQWIPVAERGRANGWIFAGVGAGAGLSIPALTWIISHYGWRASFWFSAAVGLAAGLVWFVMARDVPEEHPLVTSDELNLIQATRSAEKSRGSGTPVSWSAAIWNRNVVALTLSYFTLRVCGLDLLQLVFHLHGAGAGAQPEGQRAGVDDPVHGHDRVLPGGRIDQRRALEENRAARGRCGIAAVSLVLTAVFLVVGSHVRGPLYGQLHSRGRSGRAVSVAKLVLGGERGHLRHTLGSCLRRDEHGVPDWRRGHRIAHSVHREPDRVELRLSYLRRYWRRPAARYGCWSIPARAQAQHSRAVAADSLATSSALPLE